MNFIFILTVNTIKKISFTGQQNFIHLDELPPIQIREDQDNSNPTLYALTPGRYILSAKGFQTKEQAREAGKRLGEILLVSALPNLLDVQFDIDKDLIVRKQVGDLSPSARVQGVGYLSVRFETFSGLVSQYGKVVSKLSPRQINSARLINGSYYGGHPINQFVSLISSVEALCEQEEQPQSYADAVEIVKQKISETEICDNIKLTITKK